jgi:hypothetical protein
MAVRAVGVFAVLAIAGVAAGYGVSALQTDTPMTISVAAPVPGESPSYPVNEYDVLPDPDDPPLEPGVPLEETKLSVGGNKLVLAAPTGWFLGGRPGSWIYSVPTNGSNTYFLRVGIYTEQQAVGVRVQNRLTALESAEDNGAMENVVVESRDDDAFVANYLQGGYRRITMERFLTLGGTSAYATVAVIGREADRDGMVDLLNRVSASLRIP